MFNLPNQVAPAGQPAAPAASPAAATTLPTAPVATTIPFSMPKQAGGVGGAPAQPYVDPRGAMHNKVLAAMMTCKVGGRINPIPDGVGIFLVKSGKYKITEKAAEMTAFEMYCVRGVKDGMGLTPAAPLYTGPKTGETYDLAIFHNAKYPESKAKEYFSVTLACCGMSEAQAEQYQQTPEGQAALTDLTERILCLGSQGGPRLDPQLDESGAQVVGSDGKPVWEYASTMIANQVCVEIATRTKLKNAKGEDLAKPWTDHFWNNRVWLADMEAQGITQEELIIVFGSQEAAQAAYQMETEYRQV